MPLGVRKRDIKLSDYNISRAKYNELKYFCMQYEEKKQELSRGYGLGAVVNDGMPKGKCPGNPVEGQAIRLSLIHIYTGNVSLQYSFQAEESCFTPNRLCRKTALGRWQFTITP